jgi:hypothetical protein
VLWALEHLPFVSLLLFQLSSTPATGAADAIVGNKPPAEAGGAGDVIYVTAGFSPHCNGIKKKALE